MAEDLQLQLKKAAKDLPSLLADVAEKVHHPKIIAIKGHPCTGKNVAAFLLAAALRCPLIKEDKIGDRVTNQVDFAQSQLELGLSVVINSDLCTLGRMRELAELSETQLVIVECRAGDELESSSFEDLRTRLDKPNGDGSDYDAPKFTVEVTPVLEDMKNSVFDLVRSFAELDHGQPETLPKCESHEFEYWDVQGNNQSQFSDPTFKCKNCDFIFHKSCRELLPEMVHPAGNFICLYLKHAKEMMGDPSCSCCKQIIKGYFYSNFRDFREWNIREDLIPDSCHLRLDLTCLFLPFKRRVKLHEHELQLLVGFNLYGSKCEACGFPLDLIKYICEDCPIGMHPNCAWLPDTAVYKGHRHPFQLSIGPRDESDEYYCDVCEEARDPSHWIYYCAECDYPAHTSCLVPVAFPPPDHDNK